LAHGRANGDPTSAQLTAVGGVSVVNYGSEVCSKKFAILAIARQSVVIWESVCSTWPAHIIDAKISQSVTFLLDIVRFIGCGSAMRDRSDEDALRITQSLLAEMLGVQRPTITNAARELEHAGLIERGLRQVTILDRQGLTEESCECYQLVRTRVAFHLPKTYT
jgi:hypothetical protein